MPVVPSMLGYRVVGLPVCVLLGFRLGLGPTGLWWGLVLGLGVTALALMFRVGNRLDHALKRVVIDPAKG